MAEGKWITGLRGDLPLLDAAERVLSVRFRTVRRFLPRAAKQPETDVEYMHQLRVGCRRATAALDMFGDCLPDKRQRALRKRLKRIRRAAGEARDWDVFQLSLHEWAKRRPAREQPGLRFLHGLAFDRRLKAQEAVVELADDAPSAKSATGRLQAPDARDAPTTLSELVVPFLDGLVTAFHAAIASDTGDYAHLHQIRIAGKRLRYAMEIGGSCFVDEFRDKHYAAVEEMQEILGTANDSHVTVQWLTELQKEAERHQPADWRLLRPGIVSLLQEQRRKLPEQRRQFAAWLKRWKKQYRPFSELLATPAAVAAEAGQ